MKKTLSTLIFPAVVVLITATFSFAEYAAAGAGSFPTSTWGLSLWAGSPSVAEAEVREALPQRGRWQLPMYAVMVALFTSPVAMRSRI